MMAVSKFAYAPIDLATDAIRLVHLLKGSDGDPIRCDLFETFLHQVDGTPYEALSYTWGDSAAPRVEIALCGKRVEIRDSLHTALCCLRRSDTDRLLWIDAICIDQENDREKGHQVGQMRLIYENAEDVHIWLGSSTEDIDLLMGVMAKLDKRVTKRADYRRNSTLAWSNEWSELMKELNPMLNRRRIDGLKDLLRRPWFGRVWIIQEVFNAKRATVACGWNTVPTRTFVVMPRLLGLELKGVRYWEDGQFKQVVTELDPHVKAVLEIMPGPLREKSWRSERPALFTLLNKFKASKATDPRDRIYALMGISDDVDAPGFPDPDYGESITVQQAIQRTTSYILFGAEDVPCELPDWTLDQLMQYDAADIPKAVLKWAVEGENSKTMAELLTRTQVDPNGPHMEGNIPPLLFAAQKLTSLDAVQCLLDDPRVDVNITQSWKSKAPINYAVDRNDVNVLGMLLKHKDIDVNHNAPLDSAVEGGYTQIVGMLLERIDIDVNCAGPPLVTAVVNQHTEIVAMLLGHMDTVVNVGEPHSPLMTAIRKGDSQIVALLLGHTDIDVNCVGSPLLTAIRKGNPQIVALLLGHPNIDVNCVGSPLETAIMNGNFPIINMLIDHKDINTDILDTKNPLIDVGAESRCRDKVMLSRDQEKAASLRQSLISALPAPWTDCDVSVVRGLIDEARALGSLERLVVIRATEESIERQTALHIAAGGTTREHTQLVSILLSAGALVNEKNDRGTSALWMSCRCGNIITTKLLLDAGARVDERDKRNQTPYWISSWHNYHDIMRLLLEYGADVNANDDAGRSALMAASRWNHYDTARLLIEQGADVDACNWGNITSLEDASHRGHREIMALLIEHGANVNFRYTGGGTPLWASCQSNQIDATRLLIEHGADVNATNDEGQSGLWEASRLGCLEAMDCLLTSGAVIDEHDSTYQCTPLFIAGHGRKGYAVKILIKAGAETRRSYLGNSEWKLGFGPDEVRETLDYISRIARGCEVGGVSGLLGDSPAT